MIRNGSASRRRMTGQRVLTGWFMGIVWTGYAALSWVAYPNWPVSQHVLQALPAVICLPLAVRRTVVRRRQLAETAGTQQPLGTVDDTRL